MAELFVGEVEGKAEEFTPHAVTPKSNVAKAKTFKGVRRVDIELSDRLGRRG